MNRVFSTEACVCVAFGLALAGCGAKVRADTAAEAPPPATVESAPDSSIASVENPEQFPLATAGEHVSAPELNVTGSSVPTFREISR